MSWKRKGTATAELAVCLPVLVLLVIGVNEICSALYLKEQATIAAYEGSRIGIQRGSTNEMVEDFILAFLDERGITYDASTVVSISTPSFDSAPAMAHVTTTVTVPVADNSITGNFFADQDVSGSVTLRKEFAN